MGASQEERGNYGLVFPISEQKIFMPFCTYLSDNKPVDFTCDGTLGGSAAGKTKKLYVYAWKP